MSDRFANLSPLQRAYLAIEELQSKLEAAERQRTEPIAIIGIGCRYPGGANSPHAFWPLLRDGFDAITEVPPDRWDVNAYYDPDPAKPGKMYTRWGGFLKDVDRFDASFFNISPREATLMDPQQRLLLEVTWEALEDAGQPANRIAGSRTGVFIGIYNTDYVQFQRQDEAYAAIGNSLGIAVGRVSYTFDLQGPCMLVDTLCSSSLVAVSLACHSLRQRECNLALAGGVNLILSPLSTIMSSRLLALAPDGRCKTFDARANGYVRSEGCGVVVLKRFSDALADGDPIWALVRGAAVNQDGRSTALTAPNVLAQQAVIRQALADAGVRPEQVGYIEAHGTGTALGDPIEVEALKAIYGRPRADGPSCAIASIKTNLGHAEAAAGIAGLIKAALALKHGAIPPHLNFRELNPRIDLTATPFVIPTEPRSWPANGGHSRFAAVSSFGLSGTNAHVVMEEPPSRQDSAAAGDAAVHLLPLSARTPEALGALVEAYRGRLGGSASAVSDICYSAGLRRTHHEERAAFAGRTREELLLGLNDYVDRGRSTRGRRSKLAFVFSGHGGQYAGMGLELSRQEPVFREALEKCDRAMRSYVDWSLLELLEREDAGWQQNISQVQPAIFALQVALFELWRSWGIRPSAVVGHSMGEVAAAYAAGVLSLDHAAEIICRRSALLETVRGQGATLVIDMAEGEAQQAIAGAKALSVAASNGPRTTVVAGDGAAIADLMSKLEQQNVFCRKVQVDVAAHTPQMDRFAAALFTGLEGIAAHAGGIPFYSSVHGRLVPGDQCGAAYWVENLQRPVRFWKALQRLVQDGHGGFVELGPHSALSASIVDGLETLKADGLVRPSLRRGEPERQVMLGTLGALYEQGQTVAWPALYPNGGRHVSLPAYPWQRERYWVDPPANAGRWMPALQRGGLTEAHPILGPHQELSAQPGVFLWEFEPNVQAAPFLADHRVQGMVVVPAAVFVELALAGASRVFGDGPHTLEQIRLEQMMVLRESTRTVVQLVIQRKQSPVAEFQFASHDPEHQGGWTIHARGTLALDRQEAIAAEPLHRSAIQETCPERVSASSYYAALAGAGLEYGAAFQGLAEIWRRDGEALARLQVPAGVQSAVSDYPLHPAVLDSCFQVFAAASPRHISEEGALYLPVAIEKVNHYRRVTTSELWVHARLTSSAEAGTARIEGELRVSDPDGQPVAVIRHFVVQRLALAGAAPDSINQWLFSIEWRRQDPKGQASTAPGTILILCAPQNSQRDSTGLQDALAARGEKCLVGTPGTLPELLRQARTESVVVRGVVYLADDPVTDTDPLSFGIRHCTELLHVLRTLGQAGFRDAPRLWLVTRGTQVISTADAVAGLAQSPLWGLARTIALEHPEFACGRIDLASTPIEDEANQLAREICAADNEDQIALRPDGRYVARLVRHSGAKQAEGQRVQAGDRQFRLEITAPGILDNLRLRAASRRAPGPGEIEIEVQAAGLNFLDVMSAMGLRPGNAGSPILLGGECAGIVSATGEGVHELRPGDAVLAIAPSSFGRFVITRAEFAVRKPDRLSYEEAATIPIAFLTAYYALHELGRMQQDDRVLIHSASGGAGLAAVQLAQRAGAEIFATAGNEAKREFLRSLGIVHVMDSRSLTFADEITAITGGRGVDLVLNSLTGDAIDRSLAVLAPDGRFLEIGKKDIYQDYRLGLLPFRKGLTYFAVDLLGLTLRRPHVIAALFSKLVGLFATERENALRPLPLRVYPIADAASAFHTMAQATHIGKLVLTLADAPATPVEPAPPAEIVIRRDATYLITGGLGGVGFAIAEWLAEQGAGCLALMGRHAPGGSLTAKIDTMRKQGVRIEVIEADVADRSKLAEALAYVDDQLPPLRGVVHAAAVLDDATLMRLTESNFDNVFAPKVAGAWNLHTLTGDRRLDFFVLFSSAASVLGSPGQGNYTAANAFLDSLAHFRRARGQTALSINWGPWAEVGLAAAQENRGQRLLASMGIDSIKPKQGAAAFGRLLADPSVQVAVMAFRLRVWRQLAPAAIALPLFAELVQDTGAEEHKSAVSAKLRSTLVSAELEMRRELLEAHLIDQVAQVLRTSASRITRNTPFNTMGMDSLMGLELRNRLEASLGVSLQATLVWSHPTIAKLVPHLAATMGVPLPLEPSGDTVDKLSEQDAAALLADKLASLDEEFR